jgi:hypothetical protein
MSPLKIGNRNQTFRTVIDHRLKNGAVFADIRLAPKVLTAE